MTNVDGVVGGAHDREARDALAPIYKTGRLIWHHVTVICGKQDLGDIAGNTCQSKYFTKRLQVNLLLRADVGVELTSPGSFLILSQLVNKAGK